MSDEFQVVATPVEAVPGIITELKASFESGKTLPIEWRKQQLRNLWKLIDVWLCYHNIIINKNKINVRADKE
jgi:hypothetical protein